MALSDYNIGRDATLQIVVNGVPISQVQLTMFEASQETTELTSNPLNRPPVHRNIPKGWKGSASYDRKDSSLDDFFAGDEDAYWNGGGSAEIVITQNIRDAVSGAVSSYRYDGCTLKLDSAGSYKSEEKVEQKISFMASRRRKVA